MLKCRIFVDRNRPFVVAVVVQASVPLNAHQLASISLVRVHALVLLMPYCTEAVK